MSANWFVIQIEGADGGTVKLLPSPEAAQEFITTRVSEGVAPDRLLLFNAEAMPFGVAYQPIVTIGTDGPKHPMPGTAANAPATNGAAAGGEAGNDASAAQDDVRMSSQFRPA
jgi:hypothetical protein